jgi:hypothetical protein
MSDLVTCRKCGKEKPRADFKEYVFLKKYNAKGELITYKNITWCYDCRAIERRRKYGVNKANGKARTRPMKESSYPEVKYDWFFSRDPGRWCNGNVV